MRKSDGIPATPQGRVREYVLSTGHHRDADSVILELTRTISSTPTARDAELKLQATEASLAPCALRSERAGSRRKPRPQRGVDADYNKARMQAEMNKAWPKI